jgi:hypothetical protein
MVLAFIRVDPGDVVGDGRGKPYRELVISYRKIRRESDLGLGTIDYSSTGSKTVAIREARKLAGKFRKEGISGIHLVITGCGKENNGAFDLGDDGKFWRNR